MASFHKTIPGFPSGGSNGNEEPPHRRPLDKIRYLFDVVRSQTKRMPAP